MSRNNPKCVFVGNIPYDTPEQVLIDIFQEVGPVVNFRLVYDRESGKPKGYGFCEYRDAETALSAMRNLNNYEFNGRTLRVDFAEQEKGKDTAGPPALNLTKESAILPSTNMGTAPAITSVLEGYSVAQLYDIMSATKNFAQTNAEQFKRILLANPQLSYAIYQVLLLLGMTHPNTLSVLTAARPTQPFNVPHKEIPTTTLPQLTQLQAQQILQSQGMLPQTGVNFPIGLGVDQIEQQNQLFQTLLTLTPEQIDRLPQLQKAQVLTVLNYFRQAGLNIMPPQ